VALTGGIFDLESTAFGFGRYFVSRSACGLAPTSDRSGPSLPPDQLILWRIAHLSARYTSLPFVASGWRSKHGRWSKANRVAENDSEARPITQIDIDSPTSALRFRS
jgi:hypothetical protein